MSWWVAHAEHTLTEEVPAPPDQVRDFYVDLDNIKLVHPLIVSVETLSRNETPDGYLHSYRVRDRIPLGPFTMKITYRARLRVPAAGDVLTEADQSPGVHLRGTVRFEPIAAGTRVTERIRIAAPRLLAPMTTREAVKAHVEMLAGIRRHFESDYRDTR
ncbi:SRPBCC family protein [Mycobacterium nebraskense]|uniref:Polyketide cyclase / dehydrase and lipid transport n=1 Tax=Mycobacterium nebraskense TaxID=244292 RepID=A0A0F5NEH1_9MYCO|nr:SRPBCC family protein [Mycobacterium nebraskense]KKC05315.1 polyketide cyclase / dehydrase and lipid transport [Mycobacterium nebraskense]KLO44210.1 polyketide cyclase / dehydrase and lipid transport [Mycobacterium nebraskense]MBI2694450.1 SRPBCC family protein [Mycobacterium nebraskense]MCV7118088.1 SRPBCC family protein [Mycobacterium nebraskense]ORW28480.1 polyketide cyclase / dehydrase and lipid transport [Mycobacterium nebraskense]